MKKRTSLLFALPFAIIGGGLIACNNDKTKDSVEQADSANRAKLDSPASKPGLSTDEESSSFLVKAADGGMAEVDLSQLAQQKAKNARVKDFAAMMVHDHSAANDQVKALAAQRNVTLPAMPGDDKQKAKADLDKKTGTDFDKAYMKIMVDDHKSTIDLFKNASSKANDTEVKTFVDNTLPKLQMHLDSAQAVQKAIK
jgi:putative membrane protein